MNLFKFTPFILFFSITLSGCYVDNGELLESNTNGYGHYTNKTINVSVLTPLNWQTSVSIGGEYVMNAPDSDNISILIASTSVTLLMGDIASDSTTLDEFKTYRASQINEKEIGPKLNISINKSTLSSYPAYEMIYTYLPEGMNKKIYVRETSTLVKGKVYRIWYYAQENTYQKYEKEYHMVKNSYSILGN